MSFKALLYTYYAQKGPIGVGSKLQGDRAPWNFLDNLGSLLARGSNNKYSSKIIAEMKHLSETYNK